MKMTEQDLQATIVELAKKKTWQKYLENLEFSRMAVYYIVKYSFNQMSFETYVINIGNNQNDLAIFKSDKSSMISQ